MDIYKTTLTALVKLCFETGKETMHEGLRYTRVHKLDAADYEAGCVCDSPNGAKLLTYPGLIKIGSLNKLLKTDGLKAEIVSRKPTPLKHYAGNPHKFEILLEISSRF